jgi:hypothetical protein
MQSKSPDPNPTDESTLIDPEQMPDIVGVQLDKLNGLDEKVKSTLKQAEKAQKSAETAKKKPRGWFKKAAAIEALQVAGYELSEAVASSAEALKLGFEFQTQLAETTKYLLALGVSNIAQNRSVVQQLELRLSGASTDELSAFARKEVISVIAQLRVQQDLLHQHEVIAKKVRSHARQLEAQIEKDVEHDDLLEDQAQKDRHHDELLKSQAKKDEQHDGALHLISVRLKKYENSFGLSLGIAILSLAGTAVLFVLHFSSQ